MASASKNTGLHLDHADAVLPEHIEAGLYLVPSHMRSPVRRYLIHGISGGSFLTALLSNDLMAALGKADPENSAALQNWGRFIYSFMPSMSHGSPLVVANWIKSGGFVGQNAKPVRMTPPPASAAMVAVVRAAPPSAPPSKHWIGSPDD